MRNFRIFLIHCMLSCLLPCLLLCLLLGGRASAPAAETLAAPIAAKNQEGKVEVTLGGQPFTTYDYSTHKKPILFPVFGPGGVPMTRSWPVIDGVEGEAKDHPHHKGIWFSFDDVNGRHFWHEIGEVKNESIKIETDKADNPVIVADNIWVGADGKPVCSDTTRLAFSVVDGGRAIDITTTLRATHGEVKLGDTKEGMMAVRTHPDLRLKKHPSMKRADKLGRAINSEGEKGEPIWGKQARWVDYSGDIEGKGVGMAIFDHPSNLRHPTRWHARAYGLVAANPFGESAFSGAPAGAGDYVIPAGGSLTLRYRFVFHEKLSPEQIETLFEQFAEDR